MTTSNAPAGRRGRWHDVLIAGGILVLSFLVYNANMRVIGAADTYPARYLPFCILHYHTLYMEDVADVALQGNLPTHAVIQNAKGRTISFYPVVTPVLVSPLYLPAMAWLNKTGWTKEGLDCVARFMEKMAASLVASISAAMMFLLLRRRLNMTTALLLTIAFAFGSNTWVIGSQALWQHGMAELLVIGCLLLVTGPCTLYRSYMLGFLCGLLAFNRPPDALLSTAFIAYSFWWAGREAPRVIAGAALTSLPLIYYNLQVVGNLAGGYGLTPDRTFFHFQMLPGIAGLLFSPGRGLFVFTPFLLFLPFGAKTLWSEFRRHPLAIFCGVAIGLQILTYSKSDWRAGLSWGPRYLTDILPLLVWMLAPVVEKLRRIPHAIFVALTGVSIAIQVVGAFWYDWSSDARIMAADWGPDRMKGVWDVQNTPFLFELRHPAAIRNLLPGPIEGNIDRVSIDGHVVTEIVPGADILVEGWALSGNRTPAAVNLVLLPANGVKWNATHYAFQYPHTRIGDFFIRPDVNATLHVSAPSGWRLSLWTGNLAPGDYELQLTVLSRLGEEFRPVRQYPFRIIAPQHEFAGLEEKLKTSAALAAERIREHQQARGYWPTSYTNSTSFEHPKLEMNTFLTSMLVDVLNPMATKFGLIETLDRARHHLTDQIEQDGLVRYHGRPDEIEPSLGVKITPDADDTALVWRIAGGDKQKLPEVLRILESYRTPQGLYRTWLAPREQYTSIDPGSDPNPADVAIQMHVLMFLWKADFETARHFYGFLFQNIQDERIWVYYKSTPLIPLLRERDLALMGISLMIPENHLHTSIPGQERWVGLCQLLANRLSSESHPLDTTWRETLLTSLAKDDFAALRKEPPLLYHNDMSATVPRFYWSEDFGYALWLRLYFETIHAGTSTGR